MKADSMVEHLVDWMEIVLVDILAATLVTSKVGQRADLWAVLDY